ncbi:MAG: glycosyltransferase family 2 protein [Bacilli bacterium]|nr:glycosyltransferase family 2 protein [Bacilli bacterium]
MIKLSIIIPYYETYDYTYKLLRELSIQVTDEVEVILIDDGCNETRLDQFDFVKITHLEKHCGASYSWNRGIEQAQGKFIAFIDSDDMIMMNYIEELLKAVDSDLADEVVFGFMDVDKCLCVKRPSCRAIWKAIYRREIVPKFDETYLCNTDLPFKRSLRETEHTKDYIDKVLYAYRSVREGSITWRKHHGEFKNNFEYNDEKK